MINKNNLIPSTSSPILYPYPSYPKGGIGEGRARGRE